MDTPSSDFVRAACLEELKAKGRLVVRGRHRPLLLVHHDGRVFALDNRCPHMGFPLDRGSVEDGILTCHWHHARFDLASGCTFDLWADDVPTCPVEVRDGEIWVQPVFDYADPAGHWRRRLADGLAHNLGLVIAKAVQGQLARHGEPRRGGAASRAVRHAQPRRLGHRAHHPDRALASCSPGCRRRRRIWRCFTARGASRRTATARRRAASGRRSRARPTSPTLQRWLRRWVAVRHREAAERTVLTAIAGGAAPAALADLLLAAATDRAYADERALARLHQQGVRMSRPDRLGACRR